MKRETRGIATIAKPKPVKPRNIEPAATLDGAAASAGDAAGLGNTEAEAAAGEDDTGGADVVGAAAGGVAFGAPPVVAPPHALMMSVRSTMPLQSRIVRIESGGHYTTRARSLRILREVHQDCKRGAAGSRWVGSQQEELT